MSGPTSQFIRATVYCRKETERANTAKIAPNNQSYDVKIRASTNRLARDGGVIESEAWKDGLAAYRRNPVIQFAHRYDQPPVGTAVHTEIDQKDGSLVQYVRWLDGLTDDPYDQLAHRLRRLYETGGMRTWSVGFRILDWREPTQEERNKAAKKNEKIFWVATKAELLETSAVPVPADTGAGTVDKQIAAAAKNPTFDAEPLIRAWEAAKREAPHGGMPVIPVDDMDMDIETEERNTAILDYIDELLSDEERQQATTIQTLILPKAKWESLESAKKWVKDHGFKTGVDETENSWRFRQRNPGDFKDGSFRTICINPNDVSSGSDSCKVKAVIGKLKDGREADGEQRMDHSTSDIHVSSTGDIHFHLTTAESEDEPEKPAATEESEGETITEDVEAEAETTEPEAEPDEEEAPEEEPEPEPAMAEAKESEPEAVATEEEAEVELEVEVIEPAAGETTGDVEDNAVVIEVELEEGQEPEEAIAEVLAEKFAKVIEDRLDDKLRQITGGAN